MQKVHTKSKPEMRRTSLVAPADDLDLLRKIAQKEDRSLSAELRRLIADRVRDAA